VLLGASCWPAITEIRKVLDEAPYEVLRGGEALRRLGPPGARVVARKPQVAYFAGMQYLPLPQARFQELMSWARENRADYLFYSGMEAALRKQFLLLEDSALALPGFTQVGREVVTPNHYYVLYRFTREIVDSTAFAQALLDRSMAFGRRHDDDPRVLSYVGQLLIDSGHSRQAAGVLEQAGQLDPTNAQVACFAALAYFDAGDDSRAARECERAIGLAKVPSALHAMLGVGRAAEGRWAEACRSFRNASDIEPTNPFPWFELGIASLASGHAAEGRRALDRGVQITPALGPLRDHVVAAFAAGGRPAEAAAWIRKIERFALSRQDPARLGEAWAGP
jgi:tetratricopeptide (TPR) repeat protein